MCLRRQRPDKIPFEFEFTANLLEEFRSKTGSCSPEEYYDFDIRRVWISPTNLKTDFSSYLPDLPEGSTVDEWGVGHKPGSLYHFTKMVHPLEKLQTVDELQNYPFPDLDADYRFESVGNKVKSYQSAGYFGDGFIGHIFEIAWYMIGLDNLLVDFYQNEDFANYLLDKITDINVALSIKMAEVSCDMLRYGDDVGTQKALMMSPQTWRKYLKPRLAKEIKAAKSVKPDIHIWYHSDGNIKDIIEDLIEVGVDVLNPVQPECIDPLWVKKNYGDCVSLWGTIGTQTVMPFGTPDQVRETVKQNINQLGYNGRLNLYKKLNNGENLKEEVAPLR